MRYAGRLALRIGQSHLRTTQVAQRLGVHRNTVDRWCSGMYLPSIFWHKQLTAVLEEMEMEAVRRPPVELHVAGIGRVA